MTWLAAFAALFTGVVRGWVGEPRRDTLDKIAPEDTEAERNRKARERFK